MNRQKIAEFVNWITNRLIYKHQYSVEDRIILNLRVIQKEFATQYLCNVNDTDLDQIISKYFMDFHLDKTEELNFGFTEDERIKLRSAIRSIVDEIMNNSN